MSVIDTLTEEHHLVRRFLDNIEVALDLISKGEEIPERFFDLTVEFSKKFMDKYHHFKEEYIIFLKLAEKKGGKIDPQIVSLRDQHERGRFLLRNIKQSVPGYLRKDEIATAAIQEHLGHFHLLQKQHLNRENHVFIPMARKAFTQEELKEFELEFEREKERLGADTFQKAENTVNQIAELLKKKFGAQYRDKLEEIFKSRAHED